MNDVRVILVQVSRQAIGIFLLEAFRPGFDLSTNDGLPKDSVRFHNTIFNPARVARLSMSNPPQQKHDDQYGQQHTKSAGRVITPIPAVWPSRECADQHQNEQNH